MPSNNKPSELSFAPIGRQGVEYAMDGGTLYLKVALDRAKGKPSASGKTIVTATTGGLVSIPDSDAAWLSINAGVR